MVAEEVDHAEAPRRIQEAEQTRAPQLDLSTLFLTRLRPELKCLSSLQRSASGRRGIEADEERAGEVKTFQVAKRSANKPKVSEVDLWAFGAGVGGAKERGEWKHGRATHVPDTEPVKGVPGA